MPRVLRTTQAHEDLLEVWLHVARDSLERADRLIDAIERRCQLVAEFPEMGRSREELMAEVRSTVVRPYVVFYRVVEDGIEVLRVVHGARDISRMLPE